MDFFEFEIVNLYKHQIVHIKEKKKRFTIKTFALSLAFILLVGCAFGLKYIFTDYGKVLSSAISYIYDPVNPLYNDMGHIIFTNSNAFQEFNVIKDVSLIVPINTIKMQVEDNFISFEITSSVMVFASASGVVTVVSNLENGSKYIEIKHSKNISTRYENIDIAGVVPGEVVKSGQEIATAKFGSVVKFTVLKDGEPVSNLKVVQNKIVWEY